jgi:hypothetical protein
MQTMYQKGQEVEEVEILEAHTFGVLRISDNQNDVILLPASCLSNEELVNHIYRYNSVLAAEVKKRIDFYFDRLEYLENELKKYE